MNLIKDIFPMLDCENELFIQEKGRCLAESMNEIEDFILPMHSLYNKNIWENCAKILCAKKDEELYPFLPQLFEWLQDLNWPGTFIIIERLKNMKGTFLVESYIKVISDAKDKGEENCEWLDHLTKLIENRELEELLERELSTYIWNRYKNFWL